MNLFVPKDCLVVYDQTRSKLKALIVFATKVKNMLDKPENYRTKQHLRGNVKSSNIASLGCVNFRTKNLNFAAHCWVLLLIVWI